MKSHLKTSFAYITRAPFQALAAISVLALTFWVATLTVVLVYSSERLLKYFETRPQVIAFLKDDAKGDGIDSLKLKLSKDTRVKEMRFVSKDQALTIYKNATADNPLLGELVSPSIFPASLEFSVIDLENAQSVIDEVKKQDIVESVGFTASLGGQSSVNEVLGRLKSAVFYIRLGGLISVSILTATSLLVLMVVISMRVAGRRSEIENLSLIGATTGFIRAPIVFEALNYAFIGSLLGWLLGVVVILYATPAIISYFGSIDVLPRNSLELFGFLGIVWVCELVVAFVIAFMGSMIAVSRALTRK